MFKAGDLLRFEPFIFKNGALPKTKFFIVLKEIENKVVLASLPTSKDHTPGDIELIGGCVELPERQVNIFIFLAKKNIAVNPETEILFSFDLNTFVYGADLDTYPTNIFEQQICDKATKVEFMGRLMDDQFLALKDCLKKSKMVKNRFKRLL